MRVTRALTFVSALLVAVAPGVSGCGLSNVVSDDQDEIVIAADLELSGAAADLGTAYGRALELKIKQLNASGALGGRKIRYLPKDNRSDKTLSLANITDFTNDPSVTAIITGSCSECIKAASKTINEKQVPTISLSPASSVTTPVTKYIFKIGPNVADDAAAIASELSRYPKVTKVGVLTTNDEYGREGKTAMESELDTARGFDLPVFGQFKPTDTDVAQVVGEVLDSKPDALVVWAFAGQAENVATKARASGFTGPIVFDAAAAGDLFQSESSRSASGETTLVFPQTMVIDDVIATTPAKAARKQWFRDYTAAYGTYYGPASFAADAVQLVVDAIERTSTDPVEIQAMLESSQMDGLSGPIRITPANHSGLMPQALVALVATSGRWRLKA